MIREEKVICEELGIPYEREDWGTGFRSTREAEFLTLSEVEARHIRALLGGSGQQVTRRLQGLFHNKYLGRYSRRERMRLQLATGPPLMAYGLELKGARALERHFQHAASTTGSMALPVLWRKDYTRRTEWFLEHHLVVVVINLVTKQHLHGVRNARGHYRATQVAAHHHQLTVAAG